MNGGAARRRTRVEGREESTQTEVVLCYEDHELAVWPLRITRPGLAVAGELARLQLAARRRGCAIRLRHPNRELLELLDLVGLSGIVCDEALRQVGGEPEDGEQVGVEEVVVADDPVT